MSAIEAAREWLARKSRAHHPWGSFDGARRWYPSAKERQGCCDQIRRPTRNFPYSYLTHCRSTQHVARLFEIEDYELKQAAYVLEHFSPISEELWDAVSIAQRSLKSPVSTARIKRMAENILTVRKEKDDERSQYKGDVGGVVCFNVDPAKV